MASRRVRIKGVANIPQRRKPGVSNSEEIQNEEIIKPDDKPEIIPEIPNLKIERSLEKLANHEQNIPYSLNNTQPLPSQVQLESDSTAKPKVAAILRRRFIKPAISANVINRRLKTKVTEVAEKQTENVEPYKIENDVHINLNETQIPAICNDGIVVKKTEPLTTQANNKVISGITRLPKPLYIDGTKSGSDTEYPAPPASPSKFVNRTRIKAIPRLGQRRTSFSVGSASESEDENKRGFNRIRNDSVCSATSGTHENQPFIESNLSPIKKEFSSVIQRKCRRTEQSRKLAEARRDFQQKFNKGKPDRQRLTMIDLIFYNPTSNPMSQKTKTRLDTETSETVIDDPDLDVQEIENENVPEKPTEKAELSEEENAVPAPQITIGANGEIIVDEQSLVIENKETIQSREALKKSEIVDGDFDTGYGVYKRLKRSRDWCKEETLRFYKALNTIGTDFTLMCELFPDRTRRELKMKFKKEERMNRTLIDRAVMQPINFDMTELRLEVEKSAFEKLEMELRLKEMVKIKEVNQVKKRNRKNYLGRYIHNMDDSTPAVTKKSAAKKQPNSRTSFIKGGINSILDDDSDSDNSTSTVATSKSRDTNYDPDYSDYSDNENRAKIQKTRSGRISKPKQEFGSENNNGAKELLNEDSLVPGSIMIVTNDDSNSEDPRYTVYIVDENRKKVPIQLTPEILQNLSTDNGRINSVLDQLAKPKELVEEKENNNSLMINDNTLNMNLMNSTSEIIFENDSIIIPFDEFNCLSDEDVIVKELDPELAL